jgi:hypothetical protein
LTTTEAELIAVEVRALKESIDLWHETNCERQDKRIEKVELAVGRHEVQIATSGRVVVAAFFGAMIPATILGLTILEAIQKNRGIIEQAVK